MYTLGIESTAHTFGVGICDSSSIVANIVDSYSGEGIHPRLAADHHAKVSSDVVRKALDAAGISMDDIGLISFSQGPGLGPCLRVGATTARALSLSRDLPIIGVNHCIAHIEVGRFLLGVKDPVTLYVSGGNTQILAFAGGRYRVFGETLDIGIGNMQDTFARAIGLDFPCGKEVDGLIAKGSLYLDIPYTIKGMDFSFSGMMTEAIKLLKGNRMEDVTFSLMETAFSIVVEATERAMAHTQKTELLLAGGNAASPRLREMCDIMCRERGAEVFVPPFSVCRDNGAMIAVLGMVEHASGRRMNLAETTVRQKWRTDEEGVPWRQ
ncbi:MAG TPA: bifunctional N(6)-L-threonylcarbamoyladenine synthase/serine/threonine protein kinase [Candidatus Methanofastidiosa archaeon]|nr:bifunctional N(6)-L-threonylcarbamoyladenine synthase/serine/threonine protein kinase [Candidatus Methanofastidiosa archaeon]HPR41013.1 bifunctional N(6)-L-threonylcarbamoyladenine synthase/serine/threonine protein kinase [Candidatus Methanofastidiosa archaeon]